MASKTKHLKSALFDDTGDETGGDGSSTLTNIETLTGFSGDRVQGGADHLDVVSRHGHLVLIRFVGEAQLGSLVWAIVSINGEEISKSDHVPAVRINICGRYLLENPDLRPPSASVRT